MTEAIQLSDALAVMQEFFELHENGANLDADMCAYFRDALKDAAAKVADMESVIRGAMKFRGFLPPDPPQSYDYDRALQHQQRRDLARKGSVRVDDVLIAFPKELRGA